MIHSSQLFVISLDKKFRFLDGESAFVLRMYWPLRLLTQHTEMYPWYIFSTSPRYAILVHSLFIIYFVLERKENSRVRRLVLVTWFVAVLWLSLRWGSYSAFALRRCRQGENHWKEEGGMRINDRNTCAKTTWLKCSTVHSSRLLKYWKPLKRDREKKLRKSHNHLTWQLFPMMLRARAFTVWKTLVFTNLFPKKSFEPHIVAKVDGLIYWNY